MNFVLPLLVLLVGLCSSWARPAQIILLRHAEKPDDPSSVDLSERGQERARALVTPFTTRKPLIKYGQPAALFAPEFSKRGHSRRAYQTLQPVAKELQLQIQTPYVAKDYAKLAKQVLSDKALDGKCVVICWIHDYLPDLAEAFGIKPKPEPWKGRVFDEFWLIRYDGTTASLTTLQQKLLPGDAKR